MELDLFLRITRQTQGQFAKKIGVTRVWLNLVLSGKKIPSQRLARLIAIETNGAVLPEDLYSQRTPVGK